MRAVEAGRIMTGVVAAPYLASLGEDHDKLADKLMYWPESFVLKATTLAGLQAWPGWFHLARRKV